jgi:hypothetical protein
MKRLTLTIGFAFLLVASSYSPVQAGEPTGKIGPINPTMFRCVDDDDDEIIELPQITDMIENDPSTENSRCTSTTISDFGFDTKDTVRLAGFIEGLEDQCDGEGGTLEPITDTRIEGKVYEFHPDINNPGEWFPVPSQDVPVIAKGITFEVFWGTDEDGYYYFPNGMGAGPIIVTLRLPPDAHAINPNVVVNSTGLEETWTVFLGFYRGDMEPPDVTQLRTPEGNFLPFTTLSDLEILSKCGYMDLPTVAKEVLPELPPPGAPDDGTIEMPNVGGILIQDRPGAITALAVALAILLPTAGILKLSQKRRER